MLANIYLDRLDKYVENELVPHYTRGTRRRANATYKRLSECAQRLTRQGRRQEAANLRKQLRCLPSTDPDDPGYRRLRYTRYADDFLLGFCGPRAEAEAIKQRLSEFLQNHLKLHLAESKTLITHARSGSAQFLGYEISVLHADQARSVDGRRTNGTISLRVPKDVAVKKCQPYLRRGKPIHRPELSHNTAFSIVAQYQQEYRGGVEYYQLAHNRTGRFSQLKFAMEQSLTKTLAHKLRMSVPHVYQRYKTMIQTPNGPRKGLMVRVEREGKPPLLAHWGGISLQRQPKAVLNDTPMPVWSTRTEIIQRLLADTCELCGVQGSAEVHHLRHLKDLHQHGRPEKPQWMQIMATRRRKTLVVCRSCHDDIHAGRANGNRTAA